MGTRRKATPKSDSGQPSQKLSLDKSQKERLKVQGWIEKHALNAKSLLAKTGPHYEYIRANERWARKVMKYFGPGGKQK